MRKHTIHANITETYPSTPPVWFSESDNVNVTNALTSLSETSGINNHLSYQVKSLLRQLCTLFSLPLPVECTDSDSNSSGCSTASSLTPPRSDSASIGTKHAKESSDTDDSDEDMDNEEEDDDDEEEEIPLDLEEVEAVSKKARQDEEIHSEHMQVLEKLKSQSKTRLSQRHRVRICT